MNLNIKGKTTCPKCNYKFVIDIIDTSTKQDVACPQCSHRFTIKPQSSNKDTNKECCWEEHGEPRKTILSSLKPKTNKPFIATFLLIIVFILGIFTAFLFEFLNPPMIISQLNILSYVLNNQEHAIVIIIFSGFALVGALSSLNRRFFGIALIGGILGIFSYGFFIGLVLSIVALVLILLSRDEFENGKKGKIFK